MTLSVGITLAKLIALAAATALTMNYLIFGVKEKPEVPLRDVFIVVLLLEIYLVLNEVLSAIQLVGKA